MDILIGYESALDHWRTVGPNYLRGYDARQAATRRARRALASSERPTLSEGNRRPAGCTLPLCTLVGSVDVRTRTPAVLSSFCSVLPERSFVDAGEGFLMSTPEFCFLQMANRLSLARLIMLGYELCGTYVLVDKGPAPRRAADDGRQAADVRRRRLERSREEEGAAGFALRVGPIGLADGVCAGHAAVPAVRLGRVRITRTAT